MSTRARTLLALVTATAACGDGRSRGYAPFDAGKPLSLFTAAERQVITLQLGSLPPEPPVDPTNRHADSAAAALLGQALFFDPRYSGDGAVSCATCHIPDKGFQDDRANTSLGIGFTGRHAPTVFNVAYGSVADDGATWQFWDGRKDSLWAQALGPPENPTEMGSTRTKVALLLYDQYKEPYVRAFGAMPELRDASGKPVLPETAMPSRPGMPPNPDWDPHDPNTHAVTEVYVNFGKAIAAYERRIVSRDSRFDRFYDAFTLGEPTADLLSAGEIAGLKLFVGKAGCVSCHLGPNFTDWGFHSTGVAQTGPHLLSDDRGRIDGIGAVIRDEFNCASEWSDMADKSRCAVTDLAAKMGDAGATRGLGAFKTPTLRSVSLTAPYFHTGIPETLADVIHFYSAGGDRSGSEGTIDASVKVLDLSDDEQAHLVDFMNALTGAPLDDALTGPPTSPDAGARGMR